ncbi:MAG: type II toxin-antitoxin system YafQ family toxin, partial [Bacteroidales bacterium]|nr:type II toxin-antitoxin system YafQ family toxin [Bacteroidales bacterium]
EAHIESDMLLIWFKVSDDNVISLTRIGSHAKLFGKKK